MIAGQADMYNLTVASDHTYAVGDGRAVVHNDCGITEPAPGLDLHPGKVPVRLAAGKFPDCRLCEAQGG